MTPNPEDTRYRVYVLSRGKLTELSRTSKDGLGTALVQHFEDGEFGPNASIGILDRMDEESLTGVWLVNPWVNGREEPRCVR